MNRRSRRVSPNSDDMQEAPVTAKKRKRRIRGSRRFFGSTKGATLSRYATYACSVTFGLWMIASLEFLTTYVGRSREGTGLRLLQTASRRSPRRILSKWASQPFDVHFPLPPKNTILRHPFRPRRLHQFERFVDSKTPDHGGLLLRIFEDTQQRGRRREIYHDFALDMGYPHPPPSQEAAGDDYHDGYYAFDDDIVRNPALTYDDPAAVAADTKPRCRRTSWHRLLTLNCNTMHEYDVLGRFTTGESKFVGYVHTYRGVCRLSFFLLLLLILFLFLDRFVTLVCRQGSYRSVFLATNTKFENETNVLKTYRFKRDFDYTAFEYMRMDALVAERLTKHEEIMNIYGNCGLAMIHEAAVHGNLEDIAAPTGNGRLTDPLEDADHLAPQNTLAPKLKLEWSLRMAEAVALLHSYPDGVIVHDDIQLPQFLLTADGSLKLNDFNRAEVMLFDEENQEYCGYRNNPGGGDVSIPVADECCCLTVCTLQWRAPEEYADKPLNEKIDVWSLGNNMYTVLTGCKLPALVALLVTPLTTDPLLSVSILHDTFL